MKQLIKKTLRSYGYDIVYRNNHPWRFNDGIDLLQMDLDFAIAKALQIRTDLFFVQVGAFNGNLCDPLVQYIQRYNWQGIMIEPQPDPCAQLRKLHQANPRIAIENVAISDVCKQLPFYTVTGSGIPDWCGALASFSREHILKHADKVPGIENHIAEISVESTTFTELFKRRSVERIDILQVDTEGYDSEIIKLFPFNKFHPAIINFERSHLSVAEIDQTMDRLAALGYQFAYSGSQDLLAYNQSFLG